MNSAGSSTPSARKMRRRARALAGGVVDPLPDDAPRFVKDYHAYYKTPRGYHPRSLNSNDGWNKTSSLSFINTGILSYSDAIRSAVLLIHGETSIRQQGIQRWLPFKNAERQTARSA